MKLLDYLIEFSFSVWDFILDLIPLAILLLIVWLAGYIAFVKLVAS